MRSRLLVTIGLCVVLAACKDTEPPTTNPQCKSDSECPSTQVCRQGLCGVIETEPRLLSFVLQPPTGSAFPEQRINEDEFNIDEPVQILLTTGVRVEGTIGFANQPAIGPTGSLTFENASEPSTKIQTRVEQPEGYGVTVPAGSYRVTFVPDDPEVPSKVWPELEFKRNTDPKLSIPSSYTVVSGSLSRVDGMNGSTELLSDVTVFAVSRETGATSTTSITDDGFFNVSVLPNTGAYDLRVVPSEARPFVPNTTFDEIFIAEEDTWRPTEPEGGDILAVSLGSYEVPSSSQTFQLVSPDDIIEDWTGTRASIRVEAGRGVINIVSPIEMDGSFDLPIFSQSATLNILTTSENPGAITTLSGRVTEWPQNIEVALKSKFTAAIETWDGEFVMSATVEATPLDGGAEDVITTTTDANGEITLWLGDSDYIVTVVPQDATLPRTTLTVSPEENPSTMSIVIPEPTVVWGNVFATSDESDDLVPVKDVSVRAFETINEIQRRIGEGHTNDTGEFKLVVPSR